MGKPESERINGAGQREWSHWDASDMDGQTREGEAFGLKPNQAVRHRCAKAQAESENWGDRVNQFQRR